MNGSLWYIDGDSSTYLEDMSDGTYRVDGTLRRAATCRHGNVYGHWHPISSAGAPASSTDYNVQRIIWCAGAMGGAEVQDVVSVTWCVTHGTLAETWDEDREAPTCGRGGPCATRLADLQFRGPDV